jgi:cytidine deaminase
MSARPDFDMLIDAAHAVLERAYTPYSRFSVGAALLGESGRVHVGANVENASFSQCQCAEASAIGALIAAGDRRIVAGAIVGSGPDPCMPCGGCRQRLAEFSQPDTPLICASVEGKSITTTVGALLPQPFGPLDVPPR